MEDVMKKNLMVMVACVALVTLISAVATAEDVASCKRRCNTSSVTDDELTACLSKCKDEPAAAPVATTGTPGKRWVSGVKKDPVPPEICLFTGVETGICPDGCPAGQILAPDGKSCVQKCDKDICAVDVMTRLDAIKALEEKIAALKAGLGNIADCLNFELPWLYLLLGLNILLSIIVLVRQGKKKPTKCGKCGKTAVFDGICHACWEPAVPPAPTPAPPATPPAPTPPAEPPK
jgi:hypothetical protein